MYITGSKETVTFEIHHNLSTCRMLVKFLKTELLLTVYLVLITKHLNKYY